jgi:hypothetical protein
MVFGAPTYLEEDNKDYDTGVNWSPIGFFLKQHPGFILETVTARDNLREMIYIYVKVYFYVVYY